MYSKELFGERLKALRRSCGEKQEELGAVLGIRKSQVSEIENGNRSTTLENLVLICQHYGVSADHLLGLNDED